MARPPGSWTLMTLSGAWTLRAIQLFWGGEALERCTDSQLPGHAHVPQGALR